MLKKATVLAAALLAGIGVTAARAADGIEDPGRAPFLQSLKGKKVVFVPLAMGFDLTEAWAAYMKRGAKDLGYSLEIRDPNWNTDAGARAITEAITEKPDVLLVQNPDVQSWARLLKRAEEAGIKVVQVNMNASYPTDAFVGADFVAIGEAEGQALVDHCAAGKGPSTKIALIEGVPNASAPLYQIKGIRNVFAQHPEIQVVAEQAAMYDPAKARSIMETVLQQNPDLCGVWDVWDSQAVGTASAIKDAGKQGKVFVVTNGGGTDAHCDNLRNKLFDAYVSYDAPGQGEALNQEIVYLLQSKEKPGAQKTTYFTPIKVITRDNVGPKVCWSLDDLPH